MISKTERAIDRVKAGERMADVCRDVGIRPTTVYAALRKLREPPATCPTCRGEIPAGHRLDLPVTGGPQMAAITVPVGWLADPGFIAALLDDAGVPVAERFPVERVTRGTLTREDDQARGAVRFVWRA